MWSPTQIESNPESSAARAIAATSDQRTSRSTSGSCTPTRTALDDIAASAHQRPRLVLCSSYGRQLYEGRVGRGCGVGPERYSYFAPVHRYSRATSPSWILDAPTARLQTTRSPPAVRSISSASITTAMLHPSQASTRLTAVQHWKPFTCTDVYAKWSPTAPIGRNVLTDRSSRAGSIFSAVSS